MKVTIKDIAKECGVSPTTVSFILNNKSENIKEETKEKVLKAIEKYNYKPNPIAVGLVTKKTKNIGLCVPDIENPYFSTLSKHIQQELKKYQYNLIFRASDDLTLNDIESINVFKNLNVDGIIISPSLDGNDENRKKLVKELNQLSIPFVVIDRVFDTDFFNTVAINNLEGGYIATKHLISKGYKKVGCITGPLEVPSSIERFSGFLKALKEENVANEDIEVLHGNYRIESGFELGIKLINKGVNKIFVSNDMMAYGVYQAARKLDKKIPDDIGLVGFDNLSFSNIIGVPLSSISQNLPSMADSVCSLLLENINSKKKLSHRSIVIEPKLIIRESV